MGFDFANVQVLAQACGSRPPMIWTHDFYTLCVDPFLMRNDVQFCGAPASDSSACTVCVKGEARKAHLRAMQSLFKRLQPVVVAPSPIMQRAWAASSSLDHRSSMVVPLAELTLGIPERIERGSSEPLRVAYLGPPLSVKGWVTFQRLVELAGSDARYAFFRFGYGVEHVPNVTEVAVKVTAEDPDAMIRAVSESRIDVVISWSECFESFSYVTCEALAAGAMVIARAGAGNVPALAASAGDGSRGIVVRSEVELFALFLSGSALDLAGRRLTRGEVRRTPGCAPQVVSIV
ncbi:MAG: glycosyltransferase family 1 protein [Variovorax paradoxus]|uniref:Glycosyltransferase family 1 protein n=1 Tax=Variovorax paradoxus TaxID=34073 RepID=A0A2W5QEM2_VARPD|nr:MAG: glycosyltransferase family 1 protein [Variovorax paradoxus]